MPGISSDLGKLKQSLFGTPEWALQRIRKAKEKKYTELNLSNSEPNEKLVKFPEEIFELPGLRVLDLSGNLIESLPESLSQMQNLTSLFLNGNPA